MRKECVPVFRDVMSGNPTLNQLALIIPISQSPSADNICGVPRTAQHYGSSQSSHSGTKWVGKVFCSSSSSCSAPEEESVGRS